MIGIVEGPYHLFLAHDPQLGGAPTEPGGSNCCSSRRFPTSLPRAGAKVQADYIGHGTGTQAPEDINSWIS